MKQIHLLYNPFFVDIFFTKSRIAAQKGGARIGRFCEQKTGKIFFFFKKRCEKSGHVRSKTPFC